MRELVTNIDSKNAPQLQPAAWNVGSRFPTAAYDTSSACRITDLLSYTQMIALADAYFDKVDPCYGFIEREKVSREIGNRWVSPHAQRRYDAVLCGVAALGSYFSKNVAVPVEPQLVCLAKSILESTSSLHAPDADTIIAWVCRVIYLRVASVPISAWLASCTTMHLLEATGLSVAGSSNEAILAQTAQSRIPPNLHRAFGVAQHLNVWTAYDLGLSRVSLEPITVLPDSDSPSNYTDRLLALLPASLNLDPIQEQDDESLRSTLSVLASKRDTQPPLIMAQCNLLLCILRRLHSRRSLRKDNDSSTNSALHFLAKGLAAARQMIEGDHPWHHLANVPFQTLCILLAIDTQASLQLVGDAVQTLQSVARAYETVTLTEAYNTACLVLRLYHKRRSEDVRIISDVLTKSMEPVGTTPNLRQDDALWAPSSETEVAGIRNLMAEYPDLQNFNFDDMLDVFPDNMVV